MHPVTVVAWYVLVEARRSGLAWLVIAFIAAAAAAAAFSAQIAITETRELQAATAGALLRLCAAFLTASHVIASVAREANDRCLELALTLPISRAQYYLGKLAGHAVCGGLLSTAFALPMLCWAEPAAVAAWWISLALEAALLAAMALFFSILVVQVVPALGATAAFYLLGRSVSSMQAMTNGGDDRQLLGRATDAVASVLPRLDRATRTEWLLYGAPLPAEWLTALGGLAIYLAVAAAAGLFDFSRRNL